MNNIKKIIIFLVILVIIIISILVIVLNINKDTENQVENDLNTIVEEPKDVDNTLAVVNDRNEFYEVSTCINKFYLYLTNTNNDENAIIDEEAEANIKEQENLQKEAIYNILDERYISFKNITEDNIFENIPQIDDSTIDIQNMYVSKESENIYSYVVYGSIINQQNRNKTDFNIILEKDIKNNTFLVILQDYIEQNIGKIELGNTFNIVNKDNIERNSYNTYDNENINNETYIIDMFNKFKNYMIYDYESAFLKLNEEYRTKKFETYENFEEYANNNIRQSVLMELTSYQINNYDDYTQYVCVDQNGKYYIFNEKAVMDYELILDTYTVDLPQFTEQYNNATDAEKVLLNIQKVFTAIDDGDYRYVYNKLDSTFRQNNFQTEEVFETYMTQTFYENNSIEASNYQTNGNLHIYELEINNEDDETSPVVTKNIIMQLLEGTDFVMSFNV